MLLNIVILFEIFCKNPILTRLDSPIDFHCNYPQNPLTFLILI